MNKKNPWQNIVQGKQTNKQIFVNNKKMGNIFKNKQIDKLLSLMDFPLDSKQKGRWY